MPIIPKLRIPMLCLLLALPLTMFSTWVAAEQAEQPRVTLFSIDFCPSCMAAKRHFKNNGIVYQEFNIQNSEPARQTFERLGGRGVPFVVAGSRTMTGFHPERFDQLWQEVNQ